MADAPREPHDTREPHGDDASHETFDREIGVGGIVRFGIGLALIVVVSGLVTWWIFVRLRGDEERRDLPPSPIVQREGVPEIPEPRLQTTPERDLAMLRAEEQRFLSTYAWIDRERGVARIPIERSIEILLGQGLPARANAEAWKRPVWRNPTHARLRTEEESP